MTVTVSMPQLGESVTEGTVTRWLKKEGERVEADEPLLEVSTDKVDTEIPSPASGILRGITVAEDETVAVGAQLAIIDDAGDGAGAVPDGQAQAAEAAAAPTVTQVPQQAGPEPGGYPYAVPEPAPAPQEYAQPAPAYQAPAEPQYRPAVPEYSAPYSQAPESGYQAPAGGYAAPPAEGYAQQQAYAPPAPAPVPQAPPAPQAVPYQQAAPAVAEAPVAAPEPAVSAAPPPAPPAPAPAYAVAAEPDAPAEPDVQPATAEGPYITPLVRKLAAEHGVNLATVAGTGVGGRIRKQDVMEAARVLREQQQPAATPAPAADAQQAPP